MDAARILRPEILLLNNQLNSAYLFARTKVKLERVMRQNRRKSFSKPRAESDDTFLPILFSPPHSRKRDAQRRVRVSFQHEEATRYRRLRARVHPRLALNRNQRILFRAE